MANLVEFLVRLNDMASGPLKKLGATAQNAFTKIEESMAKVSGKSTTLGSNITQLDSKIKQLETSSQRATTSLGSLFRTGLAIAGMGSLLFMGKDIMQAGIRRQLDLTALQTMVGQGAGATLNDQLLKYSLRSTYGPEVMTGGKMMVGSGVNSLAIPHLISMMGDVAQGDSERLKSMMLAFSESSTRGNLSGITERMFIQGGLFNPIQQLHLMTHKSLASLNDDMRHGKISINMLAKAFEFATGPAGRWHDAMANIMGGAAGKWIAFTTNIKLLAGNIGLELLPALGHLTDFFNWIIANGTPIAVAIGAMTAAWSIYTVVTKWAAISSAALELAAYWPLLVVGAVAGTIAYLIDQNNQYGNSALKTGNEVQNFWYKITHATVTASGTIKGAIDVQLSYMDTLLYGMNDIWLRIEDVFQRIGRLAKGAASDGNPWYLWEALKHIGDPTTASKKRDALSATRDWHMAMLSQGLQDDGKTKLGAGLRGAPGAGGAGGGDGGSGTLGGDTTNSITGGGVRNMTININKPFTDKVEIHSVNLKEGAQEIEEIFRDMFLRITNSAAASLS